MIKKKNLFRCALQAPTWVAQTWVIIFPKMEENEMGVKRYRRGVAREKCVGEGAKAVWSMISNYVRAERTGADWHNKHLQLHSFIPPPYLLITGEGGRQRERKLCWFVRCNSLRRIFFVWSCSVMQVLCATCLGSILAASLWNRDQNAPTFSFTAVVKFLFDQHKVDKCKLLTHFLTDGGRALRIGLCSSFVRVCIYFSDWLEYRAEIGGFLLWNQPAYLSGDLFLAGAVSI